MIPSTLMAVGFARQQNIGLDKENLTGSFSYNWTPTKKQHCTLRPFNVQFVRNLNPKKLFQCTWISYRALNDIGKTYNTNSNYLITLTIEI
jgi:hypothetical protein